jgi:tetratricopeptide (TPR) repeat protein
MLTIKKKGQAAKIHKEQGIETIMRKGTDVLSSYRKQLNIALIVIAVALVIAGGYSLMRSADERKAAPLLAAAYESYSSVEPSKTDFKKALELFSEVKNKYPRTRSAAIAQYYIGNCLANSGQADEAIKAYQNFINAYGGEKFLLALVYQRMGYAYSVIGKQAEAIKAFEQAEALGGPGVATVELAKIYESMGNSVGAQKKYKIIQEKLGGTNWGIEAMGKVQKIEAASKPSYTGKDTK